MICVTQELEDFPFIFPPKQNCYFQDILISSEELASQNPKCQASPSPGADTIGYSPHCQETLKDH